MLYYTKWQQFLSSSYSVTLETNTPYFVINGLLLSLPMNFLVACDLQVRLVCKEKPPQWVLSVDSSGLRPRSVLVPWNFQISTYESYMQE